MALLSRRVRTRPFWLPSETSLIDGVRWLIKLRWLAIAGVAVVLVIGIRFFGLPLYWQGILGVALSLVILNLVYWAILRERFEGTDTEEQDLTAVTVFAHMQISLDLLLLTMLLFFSGGAVNPFSFFYIFHIIISSILLTRRDSYLQSGFAVILYGALVLTSQDPAIHHFPLYPDFDPSPLLGHTQVLIMLSSFAVTLFVAAFLSSSIMERLREKEEQLANAYQEVVKREKIKSDFARTVAHELRSPMSAIMNFIHAVRLSEKDRLSDKSQEFLERALLRGQGLIDLIRDLLDLSRLEAAEPAKLEELEEVDLIGELELILSVEKTSGDAKGVSVYFNHPPVLPRIKYSRAAVQQIFSNLISNAFRYTPPGGVIRVEVSREDHQIKCRVADTGIGIPKESLNQIFSEFYRAPNAKQFSPIGTGLGLSITKALVSRYGGEIAVESEPGKGTAFTAYFDLEPSLPAQPAS